jgi:hypothetical protein
MPAWMIVHSVIQITHACDWNHIQRDICLAYSGVAWYKSPAMVLVLTKESYHEYRIKLRGRDSPGGKWSQD